MRPIMPTPGRPVISAVTGTNGKTSVATAIVQLMRAAGWAAAGCDSTGITDIDGRVRPARFRRDDGYLPDLIEHEHRQGAEAISLEAFVGILADGLFEHVPVDVAVCTGLERDHLDVHGTIERYWGAKLSLFERHLRPDGIAVLATDCRRGDLVEAAVRRRGAGLVMVGPGGDVELMGATRDDAGGVSGTLRIGSEAVPVRLPTRHSIAVTNLLLAATAVTALGGDPNLVAAGLSRVSPPPGRLEVVAHASGVVAMVDTAHNPGALRTALASVRADTAGRVILVFGAGGERDRGKRGRMGEAAMQGADIRILTDDNPRREPPQRIREDIRIGCPDCIEIPHRREAIAAALLMARPGDIVLVAGKGDETEQLIATGRIPHDDRAIIRETVAMW